MSSRNKTIWLLLCALALTVVWFFPDSLKTVEKMTGRTVQKSPNAYWPRGQNATPENAAVELRSKLKKEYLEGKKKDPLFDWKRPIQFYGRVVDQNGDPLKDAEIRLQWSDLSSNGATEIKCFSDEGGGFSIHGIHGKGISVRPQKPGYSLIESSNDLSFEYADPYLDWYHIPNPSKPVVFTLFKHGKPDRLVYAKAQKAMLHDGSETRLEFESTNQAKIGLLVIRSWTAERTNARPRPDWWVELQLQGASLSPTSEPFPSYAPLDGYSSTFRRDENADEEKWESMFEQTFYFRTENPVRFGKIRIEFMPWGRGIKAEYWVNPTGDRSLNSETSSR